MKYRVVTTDATFPEFDNLPEAEQCLKDKDGLCIQELITSERPTWQTIPNSEHFDKVKWE